MRPLTSCLLLLCLVFRAVAQDKLEIKIEKEQNFVSFSGVRGRSLVTMEDREGKRVIPVIIAGFLVGKGIQEVEKVISNRQSKYTTQHPFVSDIDYFYDQVSTDGPMDPTGIQFKGFVIRRVFRGEGGRMDTAFSARFMLDTSGDNLEEMVNNGIFKLRIDSLTIRKAQVLVPSRERKINLDFTIAITASYRGQDGKIYMDDTIGRFVYPVRDAPLDVSDTAYEPYYARVIATKPALLGQAFLVPRSSGYYRNDTTGMLTPCWGEGMYKISAVVRETSKKKYIDQVLSIAGEPTLSLIPSVVQKKFGITVPAAAPAKN